MHPKPYPAVIDYLVLAVQGNGPGIDQEQHRNKLFQLFKRFHDHVSGTGQGLYRIRQHKGLCESRQYVRIYFEQK